MPDVTPREAEILRRVSRGETNKEIASGLRISEQAVKAHVSRLFVKFAVPNRAGLATAAAQAGITALGDANERLSSANAALVSENAQLVDHNREVDSTNTELRAAKDALQGAVDELSVANAELRQREATRMRLGASPRTGRTRPRRTNGAS